MSAVATTSPTAPDRRSGATASSVLVVGPHGARRRRDRLATEEPLEIRVGGPGEEPVSVAVTMRTPGHDHELAAGFLAAEGLLGEGIVGISLCAPNVARVRIASPVDRSRLRRRVEATSSCGLCGHTTLDELELRVPGLVGGPAVDHDLITALPGRARAGQRLFDRTGGLHAASVFTGDGELRALREDVGRHNAVDKVLGHDILFGAGEGPRRGPGAARDVGAPPGVVDARDAILLLSGRASFELVQKAAAARIAVVCAVSAPSSLAVDAARRLGVTLIGFLRGDAFNVYAHDGRLVR
ncbi:MAG: formate dehydrogenase accessory sulfurtransferase FdhD [Solirubrobacteraceae bacterium]|nr:formate dehydrogenase accessory sulfurtransferase FdhD [Solirubrobacteraceae bacterium]